MITRIFVFFAFISLYFLSTDVSVAQVCSGGGYATHRQDYCQAGFGGGTCRSNTTSIYQTCGGPSCQRIGIMAGEHVYCNPTDCSTYSEYLNTWWTGSGCYWASSPSYGSEPSGPIYTYQGQYAYEGEYSYQSQYTAQPNLDPSSIGFYDSNGTQRTTRAFSPLEPIYLRITLLNEGTSYPWTWSRTAIYRNRNTAAGVGLASDIGMYIDSSNNWPPGFTAEYESWQGGELASRYTVANIRSTNIGTNYLRVFADYDNRLGELDETDNQQQLDYTILSPDLTVTNFELLDEDGVVRGASSNPFFTTDNIYPRVTFTNTGTGRANSNDGYTDSRIYTHRDTQPTTGLELSGSNPGVAMRNGIYPPQSAFPDDYPKVYAPPPLGPNGFAFTSDNPYMRRTTPGTYRAWVSINFNRENIESNYANNFRSVNYSVEIPYLITGRVYYDNDQSGTYNTGDIPFRGATLTFAGTPSSKPAVTTNGQGVYSFTYVRAGTYTVTLTVPQHYKVFNNGGSNTINVTLGPNRTGADFGIIGAYTVSGKLFVDTNGDGDQDGDENDYAGAPLLAVASKPSGSPGTRVRSTGSGTYEISGLVTGAYTVQLTLPSGYYATRPLPPRYIVTLSGGCPPTSIVPNPLIATSCAGGNVSNLQFGVNPAVSWFQSRGGDLRFDQGFSDAMPSAPDAACVGPVASRTGPQNTTPGVVFSGNKLAVFGSGGPSSTNWTVGSAAYPELYNPVNPSSLRTSYEYIESATLQQGQSFSDLTDVCANLSSCNLLNIPSGNYKADGNVIINAFTMQAGAKVVIIVNGSVRINTNIDVPVGNSFVLSSRDNITVASSIGLPVSAGMSCPSDGQIEGFYSTDDSFVLESEASCGSGVSDRMLAIEGSVVVKADLNGGNFQNNRTLCANNTIYPTFIVTERPDMILNMPTVIKVPTFTWREIAP